MHQVKANHLKSFLNFNGCQVEGLYITTLGIELEAEVYLQKFDKSEPPKAGDYAMNLTNDDVDLDVDLLDEEGLGDVKIIGCVFRTWLRHLPGELLPLDMQTNHDSMDGSTEKVPEWFKKNLSNLPPWNYYILFAVTCHLSLLLAHGQENKTTFDQLFQLFGGDLKIGLKCCQWLINDWRNCWRGCYTELEAIKEEYRILDESMHSTASLRPMKAPIPQSRPVTKAQLPQLSPAQPLTFEEEWLV